MSGRIAGEAIILVKSRESGATQDARTIGRKARVALDEEWMRAGAESRARRMADGAGANLGNVWTQGQTDRWISQQVAAQQQLMNRMTPMQAAMRRQQAAFQIGFMVEDISTTLPTMGWQGALRAASNNASMLLMQLASAKVALGAMGVLAIAQVAPAIWKMLDGSEARAAAAKRSIEAMRASLAEFGREAERRQSVAGSVQQLQRGRSAQSAWEFAGDQVTEMQRIDRLTQAEFDKIQAIDQRVAQINQSRAVGFDVDESEVKSLSDQRVKAQEEIRKLQADRATAHDLLHGGNKRLERLQVVEHQQIRERMSLQQQSDLKDIGRIDTYDAARDKIRSLREEQQKLEQTQRHLAQTQAATGIDDPQHRQALLENEIARANVAEQLALAQQNLPILQQVADLTKSRDLAREALRGLGSQQRLGPQSGVQFGSVQSVINESRNANPNGQQELVARLESIERELVEAKEAAQELIEKFETL